MLSALLATLMLVMTPSPHFLALGDSYTIGESVAVSERWPVQLARQLRNKGIDVADPQIIAKTGWTTDELSSAIDAAKPNGPYALVTLLIGVNNQYRGRDAEQYRKEFAALLQRAIALRRRQSETRRGGLDPRLGRDALRHRPRPSEDRR